MRPSLRSKSRFGFTLIEMMASVTVLMMMMLLLVSLSSQAGKVWSRGETQNQIRQRARAAIDYMGQELRQAILPLDQSKIGYQMLINPSAIDNNYLCHDALFWQAPIATEVSQGDIAEVGYFVQWDTAGEKANLCRFFVNPSDTNYYMYTNPTNWRLDQAIPNVASASKSSRYQGLFLENVLGIWVKPTKVDGTTYQSTDLLSTQKLPAYIEISMVVIDANTAQRASSSASTIKAQSKAMDNAEDFVDAISGTPVGKNPTIVKLKVSLDNYR